VPWALPLEHETKKTANGEIRRPCIKSCCE
jgi:hypothetical protein